ncbi:hypothetical protein K505DRAFT_255944 [Melanomma pulvis-pyrius CBS 109.77]|uniref:Uncharacterized protein n=1 Tax=Melanomma pulvis-pyrius CBS 109.77 TaxID=1314802 RepID=A0A6A6WWG3_9PLEO|nr:hypothetical protein K505DRAFT_255944 [Melanomma pulvis-pyrius CBS 109.77]
MWKRLQGHVRDGHLREKDKQIGNPVLLETTYDEDQLRHIPNVSDFQDAQNAPHYQAFSTRRQQDPLNSNSLSPHDPRDYRASDVPTVSSYYSQPSPEMRSNFEGSAAPTHSGFVDVSPPSSPEPDQQRQEARPDQPRRFRSMRDVSPVDENRGQRAGAPRQSNIPVLRKAPPGIREEVPGSTQKFWGGKVAPNSKVRWDEYSGEPTSSTVGKPGQVSPLTYAKDALSPPSDRPPMGYHVSVSGPHDVQKKNAPLPDRTGRSPTGDRNATAKPAQPWDRASGRAEIVKPFKDTRSRQPLNFQRQTEPKTVPGSDKNVSSSLAATVKRAPVAADTVPVAEDRNDLGDFDSHEEPIKPIVPLKVGRNSPPRSLASPTSPHNPGNQDFYSYPSPITPTNKQPSPLAGTYEQGESNARSANKHSTPPNTKVVRKSIEGTPGSTASKDNGLASRFSWTTYNTSTTYQQSPPPSPPPPLPVSRAPVEPLSAASSILNRRRPLPASDKVPTRKPVSSATMSYDPPSPRPDSTFSTNTQKALPRPPTEISAADHVDTLEAQMDDLRIRRSNVFRLLQDLNNMAPPNPLITDFKRMRLVDRRKKEFEDELAEIRREEHDVGLKLHRAYRKRENADPGSESAIWIRRVTR